jgi:type I restriction enzyme S subunit
VFLEKEMVLVPPSDLQEHFALLVLPHYELASNLGVKNANLRATRDLLLPKLISGELDVSTLPEPEEAIAA